VALSALLEIHGGMERAAIPTIGSLFARLRLRAASRLASLLHDDPGAAQALDAYVRAWSGLARPDGPAAPVPVQLQHYLAQVERERPLLQRLRQALPAHGRAGAPAWHRPWHGGVEEGLSLLEALASPQGHAAWDARRSAAGELLADRWERLLFDTTLVHFDDFLQAGAGGAAHLQDRGARLDG